MERSRVTLAFLVCMVLIFIYYEVIMPRFFPPPPPSPPAVETPSQPTITSSSSLPKVIPSGGSSLEARPSSPFTLPVPEGVPLTLTNGVLTLSVDPATSAVTQATLSTYKDETGKQSLTLLTCPQNLLLDLEEGTPSGNPSPSSTETKKAHGKEQATPLWHLLKAGKTYLHETRNIGPFHVIKTLRLKNSPGTMGSPYALDVSWSIENITDQKEMINLTFSGLGCMVQEDSSKKGYLPATLAVTQNGKVTIKSYQDFQEDQVYTLGEGEQFSWAALENKYFALALLDTKGDLNRIRFLDISPLLPSWKTKGIPFDGKKVEESRSPGVQKSGSPGEEEKTGPRVHVLFHTRPVAISPQGEYTFSFLYYLGPKKTSELNKFSAFHLDELLSFGFFSPVARFLLLVLKLLKMITGSYGWSIILLTLLVRLFLFPFTKKYQTVMYRMQQLQPKFNQIREKYKEDRQKQTAETMKLYKQYGVNPLMGCLPMLIQIPIFYGLWRALDGAIELRQAPFLGWIHDLSRPDQTLYLGVHFLGDTYLHLLPILVIVVWFLQTLLTPMSPDPQAQTQRKIFMFMPILFGFMFYSFPSGLNLYWFMSSFSGVGEQILIRKWVYTQKVSE